jgi:catechol 2,3-dioxygenase-like lactoylglutathione lyase family enzyme
MWRESCFLRGVSVNIRIAVVSLWAEDVPAAVHFYRDVIGLPLPAPFAENHPYFDLGGTYLTIVHGCPARSLDLEPRFPVVALAVPDLDAAVEKLRTFEVNLPWGIETNATERWVMFYDPAGNLLELVEIMR